MAKCLPRHPTLIPGLGTMRRQHTRDNVKLRGKRDFSQVIKVTNQLALSQSQIIPEAASNHTSPLKVEGFLQLVTEGEVREIGSRKIRWVVADQREDPRT